MYHIIGVTKYTIFSGTNIEHDFIKIPPQTIENLCWNRQILKILSSHYKTKKKLSSKIIDKMIKIRNLNVGYHYKKHIMFSLYDQFMHSSDLLLNMIEDFLKIKDDKERKDNIISSMIEFNNKLYQQIMYNDINTNNNIIFSENTIMLTPWLNIIGGIDGRYYSYIWSKVISSKIYHEKFSNKPLVGAGNDFSKYILSKGGSEEAGKILRDYLKKDIDIDGFLKMYDLDTDAEFSFFFNTEKIENDDNDNSVFSTEYESSYEYTNRFTELNTDTMHENNYRLEKSR